MELERLGPYKIGRQLGQGGMGTVYAATEVDTGRPAAVKVLAPQLAASEGFRERFAAEIDSLKQLEHPNIVRLYGYGQQDQYVYYAMELVEGCSLEDELRQGRRFEWREVSAMGIKLCRALKLAHDHGIIHRDIKPANLLCSMDNEVKLTDFGIARLFGNTGLTSAGGVLGTAEYMAPEQADGRPVTHHCDLYSLGGVLYALLAGRAPFRSKSVLEMLQMQRFSRPEPVRRYAPDTPAEMELIISQLLEKDPKDRFPNALLVARRLEAMQQGLRLRDDSAAEAMESGDGGPDLLLHSARRSPEALRPLSLTVDADAPDGALGATPAQDDSDVEDSDAVSEEAAASSDDDSQSRATLRVTDHFTTIEDERRRSESSRQVENPLISAPTWIIIASLLATGMLAWYLLQPPSAESLYNSISAAAAEGDDQSLMEVSTQIAAFLENYPGDPRSNEVLDYKRRVNMLRLERTATAQARMLNRRHPDSPIGAEYLAAIKLAEVDAEKAAIRLGSLIDLYGSGTEAPRSIRDFVDAARQQLPRIEQRVRQDASTQFTLVDERLRYAQQVMASDPAEAQRVCKAIVRLYDDKPWARDVVDKAQATLDELQQTAHSGSP